MTIKDKLILIQQEQKRNKERVEQWKKTGGQGK